MDTQQFFAVASRPRYATSSSCHQAVNFHQVAQAAFLVSGFFPAGPPAGQRLQQARPQAMVKANSAARVAKKATVHP